MASKKKAVGNRKKQKEAVSMNVPPPVPDPLEIARQARLADKYKRHRFLLQNIERLIHMTYDKQQFNKYCKTCASSLENEMLTDLIPYHVRRKELFEEMKQRFVSDASNYSEYLKEKRSVLHARFDRTSTKLNGAYSQLEDEKAKLEESQFGLRYLKAVKEDQTLQVRDLQLRLADAIKHQKAEMQRIRSRHARHRLKDLERTRHRMQKISKHLTKETETHFIRQLEKQGIENRKLRTTIADFVSQIEILKKFRDHLQNKDRAVGFEYQYLLKYHKATQSLLLQILPVASESTNSRIPKPPLALSSARSERWLKLWNWDDFKTQREICGSTRDFGLSGQEEGSAAVTGKHERKTSNEIRRAPIALVSSKRTFFPQSWKGILTQKNLEHRLNRGETPSKTCVK